MVNNIEAIRKSRNKSRSRLARELEITEKTLYNIERSLTVPSVATALKLSKLLDISVEELFGGSDEEKND